MVVNVCFILSNIVQKDNALFICHKKQLTCMYTTFLPTPLTAIYHCQDLGEDY